MNDFILGKKKLWKYTSADFWVLKIAGTSFDLFIEDEDDEADESVAAGGLSIEDEEVEADESLPVGGLEADDEVVTWKSG